MSEVAQKAGALWESKQSTETSSLVKLSVVVFPSPALAHWKIILVGVVEARPFELPWMGGWKTLDYESVRTSKVAIDVYSAR